MPVIVLVADGARADAFDGALTELPSLRRLRNEGALHRITSVFPSVTGPAYVPFLTGRFPGAVGIPGLRWYDRERTACGWPDHARSYVGYELGRINRDLDPQAPTIFELVPDSIAALSVITRGLPRERRLGELTIRSALRVARTHFSGRVERWLDLDREVADAIVHRMRTERPEYLFAAFTGIDKVSHARGHDDPLVHSALAIVDDAVRRLRDDAERGGWWEDTQLWVVSDHGHSSVERHDDLAGAVAEAGYRTVSHPWSAGIAPDVAVMVSGNAMAHVYVDLASRRRGWWGTLAERWEPLAAALVAREACDLLLLPMSPDRCEVRSATRGTAIVRRDAGVYRYEHITGDPLQLGDDLSGSADETHEATRDAEYPDALVQVIALAGARRAGDLILSASSGWDFRSRYEPIPHRSSHGGLHRDHMQVPLLTSRAMPGRPRRTTDVFASTLDALGVARPPGLDGRSWMRATSNASRIPAIETSSAVGGLP